MEINKNDFNKFLIIFQKKGKKIKYQIIIDNYLKLIKKDKEWPIICFEKIIRAVKPKVIISYNKRNKNYQLGYKLENYKKKLAMKWIIQTLKEKKNENKVIEKIKKETLSVVKDNKEVQKKKNLFSLKENYYSKINKS